MRARFLGKVRDYDITASRQSLWLADWAAVALNSKRVIAVAQWPIKGPMRTTRSLARVDRNCLRGQGECGQPTAANVRE